MVVDRKALLENKGVIGGAYCNAIDEDVNDSSSWSDRMPSDGYRFYEKDSGEVLVVYEYCFACWDGWDSDTTEEGVYPSMEVAIEATWSKVQGSDNNKEVSNSRASLKE